MRFQVRAPARTPRFPFPLGWRILPDAAPPGYRPIRGTQRKRPTFRLCDLCAFCGETLLRFAPRPRTALPQTCRYNFSANLGDLCAYALSFSLSTFNFRLSTSPPANSAPNSFSTLSANSVVNLFASSSLRFIVDSLNRILLLRAPQRSLRYLFPFDFQLSTVNLLIPD